VKHVWGLFFISPWLIGFLIFYVAPMIASFVFSLYDFTLSAPEKATFIGLTNYQRMLFQDPLTWESLFVTFRFALISAHWHDHRVFAGDIAQF